MNENDVAKKLEDAKRTAPYAIEKERYQMAIDEINRLQQIAYFGCHSNDESIENPERIQVYHGSIWNADESDDSVRIFRGNLQIIKAPKNHPTLEPYWPNPSMIRWILDALNVAEKSSNGQS